MRCSVRRTRCAVRRTLTLAEARKGQHSGPVENMPHEGDKTVKANVVVGVVSLVGVVAFGHFARGADTTNKITDITPGAVQGEAKAIVVPEKDYRQLKKEDGLDANLSIKEAWFTDGGTKMEGKIDSITFVTPSGKTLSIKLASQSVTGGKIETVDYGVMYMKPGSTFTAQLFLTESQISAIKKKIEGDTTAK